MKVTNKEDGVMKVTSKVTSEELGEMISKEFGEKVISKKFSEQKVTSE